MEARPSLLDRVADAQKQDPDLSYLIQSCKSESRSDDLKDFDIDIHGCIRKKGGPIVPNVSNLRNDILEDCHRSKYTIHLGSSKMYADMKRL